VVKEYQSKIATWERISTSLSVVAVLAIDLNSNTQADYMVDAMRNIIHFCTTASVIESRLKKDKDMVVIFGLFNEIMNHLGTNDDVSLYHAYMKAKNIYKLLLKGRFVVNETYINDLFICAAHICVHLIRLILSLIRRAIKATSLYVEHVTEEIGQDIDFTWKESVETSKSLLRRYIHRCVVHRGESPLIESAIKYAEAA